MVNLTGRRAAPGERSQRRRDGSRREAGPMSFPLMLQRKPRHFAVYRRIMARCELGADFWVLGPCFLWTGPTSGNGRGGGYPRMSLDGQSVAVHRVMYTLAHGYIPGRKQVDHICRNRLCVNPDHLEMVTHRENSRRRDQAKNGGEAK